MRKPYFASSPPVPLPRLAARLAIEKSHSASMERSGEGVAAPQSEWGALESRATTLSGEGKWHVPVLQVFLLGYADS